jgi:serine protease
MACLLLAFAICFGCGGGGGGGGGGSSTSTTTPGFTLSGTISLPDTATVDSDTNDPNQAGWASNDTPVTAQAITTPIQLIGSLNLPGTGPSGKNFAGGDLFDAFVTTLTAGQVIEMVFVGNPSTVDMDLGLYDAGSLALVGSSFSSTSNSECIRVTRSGSYYIVPQAYKGAALYTLRIGAPGENTTCSNSSTSTEMLVPGQLVAKLNESKSGILGSLTGLFVESKEQQAPELLNVPESAMQPKVSQAGSLSTMDARDETFWRSIGTIRHMKDLQASGKYEYVEPNFRLELLAGYAPNDPSYLPQRWHYEQISLPSAMDRLLALSPAPSIRPLVAVIDTGIVSDHPDLQTQISGGYSFITTTTNGDGKTSNPDDPRTATYCSTHVCWHGSHVAGTIAAISDNNLFGAGVAKMAQLMPLRVFKPGSGATSYDVTQAILYASGLANNSGSLPARKADVINMSLGSSGSCPAQFATAIAQARAQNVIVVAAAGNSTTVVGAPANCAGVISVGALDALKRPTWYSNFGPNLSLAAPGGDSAQSTTGTGYSDSVYSTLGAYSGSTRIASFGPLTGTSMASPHVAGVMALMRYVYPAITPAQIDTLLTSGKLTDDLGTSGRDDATGYGLINARKAVDEALTLASSGGSLSGIIVASPSSISFGSNLNSATLTLSTTAATSEVVTSLSASSAAITITAGSNVNALTKLGDYTLSVNRGSLPVGTSYPTLTITSSARTITVQLTIVKQAISSSANANFGSVWVQATNASTGTLLARQRFNVTSGNYLWSLSGIPAGNVNLIASTDLDNDQIFCELGEACGDYPGNAQVLLVSGNMSGLNFSITPTLSTSP